MSLHIVMPWTHRVWAPAPQAPSHWFSHSVPLWVELAGFSAEPKFLSLWLPSSSDHFPSHIPGAISALGVFNTLSMYIHSVGQILPLTYLFTTMSTTCWMTL